MKYRKLETLEFLFETTTKFVLCVIVLYLVSKLFGIFTVETTFGVSFGLILYDVMRFAYEKIKMKIIIK